MRFICPDCSHPFMAASPGLGQRVCCPVCGRVVAEGSPAGGGSRGAEVDPGLWRHERRRMMVLIWVVVLAVLAVLGWLLLHRSAAGSPGRGVKEAVFGRQIAEAAERLAGETASGREGAAGQASGEAGEGGGAAAETAQGAGAQSGAQAEGAAEGGRGHGTRLTGPVSGPANPQHPSNNAPERAAPAARSIGWLDRFFGTEGDAETALRPGEGGTGDRLPGAGNTNAARAAVTDAVAAQFTEGDPPAPVEVSLEEAPPALRATNRAPPTPNALNDNFEQLLRQHRAGSGDVRISLMWRNKNDLDLHVVEPRGEEIYYSHRASAAGGVLDIDMNASPPFRNPAVENVFWPSRAAPAGTYRIYVNHYRRNDVADATAFTVRILVRGRTTDFNGSVRFGEAKKLVHQFNLTGGTR